MTIIDVLRHQWTRQWRSTTWGRNLVATILLVVAAAYFGMLFVGLGWFYPEIVAEAAPDRDPLRLLNASLLYGAGGLTVARFFLQRSAGSDVRPYLHLPLRRAQVVRVMQVLSSLSLLNVLPVVTLAALWGSTVWPATDPAGAALWAAGALLAVALTQFANSLLRIAWDRGAALVLGGGAVLAAGLALAPAVGVGGVRALSAWLFGGLSAGRGLPLAVLLLAAGVAAVASHRALWSALYDVVGEVVSESASVPALRLSLDQWRTQRRATSVALLDAKLILRNKRPRQMLLAQLPLVGIFAVQFSILPSNQDGVLEAFIPLVYCFVLAGQLGLVYLGFGYSWHGRHFDGLLARLCIPHVLVRGQYLTFAGLCVGQSGLVSLFAVARPSLLVPLASMLLYHLGATAPLLLVGAAWTREAIQLGEGAMFNYQGNTTTHFVGVGLGTLLLMALPVGLTLWVGRLPALSITAGVGTLGLAAAPIWTQWIGKLLWWQRHAMAAGYRNE